jgi:hypothetical protein
MKILILISLLSLSSCGVGGGGTTTGNPLTTVRMLDKSNIVASIMKKMSESLIPSAYANVSSISMCFKRLRFKPVETTEEEAENVDLTLGQVTINPAGTNLVTVSIPEGNYRRIEFDLEPDCGGTTQPSVRFTKSNNVTLSTSERLTIKFDGNYVVSEDGTLDLDIDKIITGMDAISSSENIKDDLEAITGDF